MGIFRRLDVRLMSVVIVLILTIPAIFWGVTVFRMKTQNARPTETELPAWTVVWHAPTSKQGIMSADAALVSGLNLQRTVDGSQHAPARIQWLLRSSSLAIAIAQADPASQFRSLIYVIRASEGNSWIEDSLDLETPQLCGRGTVSSQELEFLGSVCSFGQTRSQLLPILIWVTPTGRQFIAYRMNLASLPVPVGASAVRVESKTGWLTYHGGLGTLTMSLNQHQTLGVTGPPDSQSIESAAALLLQHLAVF